MTVIALLMASLKAWGSIESLVEESPAAMAVLEKKCIQAGTSGAVALPFDAVVRMVAQPDLLERARATYAATLAEGKAPTVTVIDHGHSRYEMINRKGRRTEITEVYRHAGAESTLDSVYHVKARRFFGLFEAVIHVQGQSVDAEQTRFSVDVYAYPHNRLVRGVTRQLRLVERFFDKKTVYLTDIITQLGEALIAEELGS